MNIRKNDDLTKHGIIPTTNKKTIPLGDKAGNYQVFKIPLELLKYNLTNGRIYMEVEGLQRDEQIDLKELRELNLEEYNNEIQELIWESSVEKNKDTKKDIEKYGQLEDGVILNDGTIIDGNRRFTCLRKLNKKYPDDDKYKYFKAAIIFVEDDKVSVKDIKKYELEVQYGRDEKVDYKTINYNMSIYNSVKNGHFTVKEMADVVRRSTNDIAKIVRTSALVDEFLDYINQSSDLVIAEKLNIYWPLEPLGDFLHGPKSRELSIVEKNKVKELYFDYMLTLSVDTPTQTLRKVLLNRVFLDTERRNSIIKEHEDEKKYIYDNLYSENHTPDEFLDKVNVFKQTENVDNINYRFRELQNDIDQESTIQSPVKILTRILNTYKDINLVPHLSIEGDKVDEVLSEVEQLLEQIIEESERLQKQIKNKG